jgi:hypothetical protein
MSEQNLQPGLDSSESTAEARMLTPAARRALAEAEARRRAVVESAAARPKEIGGRGGEEPVRYGDWEVRGLATDF